MSAAGEGFKQGDSASYDRVADRFQYWTERVSTPLARTVVDLARLRPEAHVLDVGCGSGIVSLSAPGRVTGIDISEGMLDRARSSAANLSLSDRVDFRSMDAESLTFPDSSFDSVVSLFALLHFPDPAKALSEAVRVVKPGGTVVVGIGTGPPLSWASGVYAIRRAAESVHQLRGTLLIAPGYLDRIVQAHIPEASALETVPTAQRHTSLAELFRSAGLRVTDQRWQSQAHTLQTAEEFWDLQTTFSSVSRKRLQSTSAHQTNQIRREFDRGCAAVLAQGGRLIYRNAALIVTGVRR